MNKFKFTLVALFLITFSSGINAQKDMTGRVPEYEIAYELPTVDHIKEILNRIRVYYESSSTQSIIDSKSGKKISDFSTFNPNAEPSRGFSSEWSYTHGVVLSAFEYIDDVTGDKAFFADNIKFYNYVLKNLPYFVKNKDQIKRSKIGSWGRILEYEALDDCGSISAAMIKTYLKTKNEDYLELINRANEHVSKNQFRLDDGTLARNRPQYASVWADDMYMGVPFLTNMGVLTGETSYFDDAIKQILQMADRLYIPEKELFDHGWNVTSGDYDPRFYWGRANGWVLMSMAEVLETVPESYLGRDKVLHLYRSMIRSLANLQDGTGFWHNLLDKNDTYLETSCTAMFTFAIAKGINEGWISHVYGPVALTGWNALQTRVLENGAVDGTCEGTTFAHDNTYYYHRGKSIYASHGYGPVLYAGAEMIRLLQNEKIEIVSTKFGSINSTFHFLLKSEWPAKK
ncbi:MAG: glycoside hydrolase family 105 protein [Prolixibacteraceae bacterium]